MTATTGILAALSSPLASAIGMVIWSKHWSGSEFALNMFVCTLASVGFLILSTTTRPPDEGIFPSDIFTGHNVGFLMLSSTIAILIGDWTWFRSLTLIGPVRVALFGTAKPFFAAFLGWLFFEETLHWPAWVGMVLTVGGILWVSLETEKEKEGMEEENGDEGDNDCVHRDDGGDSTIDGDNSIPDIRGQESGSDSFYDEPKTTMNISLEGEEIPENAEGDTTVSRESTLDTAVRESAIPGKVKGGMVQSSTSSWRGISITHSQEGYFMASVNIILDTFGSVITRKVGADMTTWEINLIRFGFASAVLVSLSLLCHLRHLIFHGLPNIPIISEAIDAEVAEEEDGCKNRPWYTLPHLSKKAWAKISLGVAFNAFLSPALTSYALFQIALALVLTLISREPIYTVPLNWLLQKERPTLRTCIGAVIACVGVAVISFFGTS
mmetsp:Transcript_22501/g.48855  ORF Transcript_22501/g.48855 Transcript_22501/m.48855 type:complete len:439 (+) Transcript_22501:163-1479(+)